MDLHHITDSDLERYYIGTFDGVELSMLEEHLEWCSPCGQRLDTIDRLDSMAPKDPAFAELISRPRVALFESR
jgi:hypothetical protein